MYIGAKKEDVLIKCTNRVHLKSPPSKPMLLVRAGAMNAPKLPTSPAREGEGQAKPIWNLL